MVLAHQEAVVVAGGVAEHFAAFGDALTGVAGKGGFAGGCSQFMTLGASQGLWEARLVVVMVAMT